MLQEIPKKRGRNKKNVLKYSTLQGEKHKNKESEEKGEKIEKSEDVVAVIGKFKGIRKSKKKKKKKSIIWLVYQQGQIFSRFKENEKIVKMITEFDLSSCNTNSLEISIAKLVDKHPKVKHSSFSLLFLKNHIKLIKKKFVERALVNLNNKNLFNAH